MALHVVGAVAQLGQDVGLAGGEVVAVDELVALGVVGRVDVDELDLAKVAWRKSFRASRLSPLMSRLPVLSHALLSAGTGATVLSVRAKGGVVGLLLCPPSAARTRFLPPRCLGRWRGPAHAGFAPHPPARCRRGRFARLGEELAQQFQLLRGGLGCGAGGRERLFRHGASVCVGFVGSGAATSPARWRSGWRGMRRVGADSKPVFATRVIARRLSRLDARGRFDTQTAANTAPTAPAPHRLATHPASRFSGSHGRLPRHPPFERHKRCRVHGVHAGHGAVGGDDDGKKPGESSSTLARRAWATQKSSSASLSLMGWGRRRCARGG